MSRDIIRTVTPFTIRLKVLGRAKLDMVIEGLDIIKPSSKGALSEESIIIKKIRRIKIIWWKKVRVFTNRVH